MWGFGRKRNNAQPTQQVQDEKIVSVELSVMDERFDRAAGRFCSHCGIHGSHHSDQHNDFARAALKRKELHY